MRNVLSNSTLDRPSGKLPLSRFHATVGFGSPVSCEIIQTENICRILVILSMYIKRGVVNIYAGDNGTAITALPCRMRVYVYMYRIFYNMLLESKWVNISYVSFLSG